MQWETKKTKKKKKNMETWSHEDEATRFSWNKNAKFSLANQCEIFACKCPSIQTSAFTCQNFMGLIDTSWSIQDLFEIAVDVRIMWCLQVKIIVPEVTELQDTTIYEKSSLLRARLCKDFMIERKVVLITRGMTFLRIVKQKMVLFFFFSLTMKILISY